MNAFVRVLNIIFDLLVYNFWILIWLISRSDGLYYIHNIANNIKLPSSVPLQSPIKFMKSDSIMRETSLKQRAVFKVSDTFNVAAHMMVVSGDEKKSYGLIPKLIFEYVKSDGNTFGVNCDFKHLLNIIGALSNLVEMNDD
jgi:hypothetical protein